MIRLYDNDNLKDVQSAFFVIGVAINRVQMQVEELKEEVVVEKVENSVMTLYRFDQLGVVYFKF